MAREEQLITTRASLDDGMSAQITGEIDYSRSPALRAELMEILNGEPARLILDLGLVPFMDSSGVATLIEALQVQRRAGRKLVLHGLQPKVRGIFEIARLDTVFTIVDGPDAAQSA